MAKKIRTNLSFIGRNVKKIRQVRNISQAEFAKIFNLSRPSVGAYEEGRAEPKIDTLIQMANHFGLSIDVMLTRELTTNDIYSLGLVNRKLDEAHNISPKRAYTPPETRIPFIERDDYVGYIVGHQRRDFIEELKKINCPPGTTAQICFEAEGEEMRYHNQGIHPGDLLFAELTEFTTITELINKVVIVVTSRFIKTRRVDPGTTEKNLLLLADNPSYEGMEIEEEDCLQLFKVTGGFSKNLYPPSEWEHRILKIEQELKELKPD